MKMKIHIVVLIAWLSALTSYAQDAHISQFYNSPLVINPGATGMFQGYNRMHLHYRSQWAAVINDQFITSNVSYEKNVNKFGYGILVNSYKAGSGGYNELHLLLSGAYEITNDPTQTHNLSFGVQAGIIQKSVGLNDLTFNNQYSKLTGGTFSSQISSGESSYKESIIMPDLNAGIYYYQNDKVKRLNPYFGFSGSHITQPMQSFLGTENRLSVKWNGVLGTKYRLNDYYTVEPNLLYMRQVNQQEIFYGGLIHYKPKATNYSVYFGPYYRNKDALVFHFGFFYEDFNFGFNYDVNTSGLKSVTNYRGAFEFSITYMKPKGKYVPSIM